MPYSFGPPFVDFPPAAMLGDVLMQAGDFAAAAEAYSQQLERTRGKRQAEQGLAKARAGLEREG